MAGFGEEKTMNLTGYDLLCYFIEHYKELTKEERRLGYEASFVVLQKHFRMKHPYWKLKRQMLRLFEAANSESLSHLQAPGGNEKDYLAWKYQQVDDDIAHLLDFIKRKLL